MTNGWMDDRAEAERARGAKERGKWERERERKWSRLFWTNYCQRAHLLPASYFVPHKRRFIMATRVNISRTGFFFFKETVDDAAFYRDRGSFLQNRESVLSRLRIARMTHTACETRLDSVIYVRRRSTHYVTRNCRSFVSRYRRINARDCIIRENFWEPIGGRLIARERCTISWSFCLAIVPTCWRISVSKIWRIGTPCMKISINIHL